MNNKMTSLLLALLLCGSNLSANLKNQWKEFLITLEAVAKDESYKNDIKQFKAFLTDLKSVQALSLWQSTIFYQEMQQQPIDALNSTQKKELTQRLLRTFVQSNSRQVQLFIKKLILIKNTVDKINSQRGESFNSALEVQQLWDQIKSDLITPITTLTPPYIYVNNDEFARQFKTAPLVLQLVACDVLRTCIDTIDATIKTMKSSPDLDLADKIVWFKTMLPDFNELFGFLALNIMPEHSLKYHDSWPLKQYLATMQAQTDAIVSNLYYQSSFVRSSRFSVNAAMLGSGTAYERHYPQTAEDIFMLIHQNSLMCLAGTYKSLCNTSSLNDIFDLPEILQEAIEYFESGEGLTTIVNNGAQQPARIGINYTPDSIELLYNMALNNHSSTFQLVYDQNKKECTLNIQFLGQARGRWEQIAFLAAISEDLSNLRLVEDVNLDIAGGIVTCGWIIQNSNDLALIAKYVGTMAWLSFERNLDTDRLRALYRTPFTFEQAKKQAYIHYEQKYGHGTLNYFFSSLMNNN